MAVDDAVEKKSRRRRKRDEEAAEAAELEQEAPRGLTEGKGRATPGKRNRQGKDDGGNFIVRSARGTRDYLRGVQDELDKVVWPDREELIRLSRIVIVVTIMAAIVLGAFSIGFTQLFAAGLENELVFVAFGVAVTAAWFIYTRFFAGGQDNTPY